MSQKCCFFHLNMKKTFFIVRVVVEFPSMDIQEISCAMCSRMTRLTREVGSDDPLWSLRTSPILRKSEDYENHHLTCCIQNNTDFIWSPRCFITLLKKLSTSFSSLGPVCPTVRVQEKHTPKKCITFYVV